ncbi:DUF4376 domain-containing protein [Pseudomonas umsongensis]|uniref:DUF4376 domain-containing protein n=1 Tax=Pseudomonas umsongensis TaxID=198618 RepID=UPI00200B7DC6|nr:DUF4376 domain-containing protein [Pseudomonas umsongensis]MCK8685374.1 DUF4376 domain-containing protein [Pseudomonas umsongensis]
MIKVYRGIATREPIPGFLLGLLPESLADLSWTDPALGVQDAAWWPEEDVSGELGINKKWGAEVLTLDAERRVVLVARKQVAMTVAEKAERDALIAADWRVRIAARRFQAETGGVTVQGIPVNTERDSQALLTGAAFAASLDPAYQIKWKAASGFVELSAAQVIGLASEVRAFVQACFNREAELLGFVADGSITTDMLEEGWPA